MKTQALMTFEIAAGLTSILQPLGCIASTRQLAVFTIFKNLPGPARPFFFWTLTPLVLPKFRAFCLKLDLATVLISLMLHYRQQPRARRRWLREFGSAPACFSGVAHAVLHALNPRHRTLAPCTRRHADHSVLLLRRHHEALPHDLKSWSAPGTAHLRLPVLQSGRYKGS